MVDRLHARIAAHGGLGGESEIGDRFPVVLATLEVRGELRRDLARAAGIGRLLTRADPPVRRRAGRRRHRAVEHVAVERVDERVAAGHRAVGPRVLADDVQELSLAGRRDAALLDRPELLFQACGDARRRELDAGDARDAEEPPLVRIEAVEPALDHLAQVLGHCRRERGLLAIHDPLAASLDHPAVREPVLEHIDHEERAAVRPVVEQARQLGGHGSR